MNATIMAVVGNTILNPIFIYGMNMGIRGAATATILAQIVSLLWQGGERLPPPQGAYPVQTWHLPPEKENRQGYFRHRHVSLPDEQLRLPRRNPHQPRTWTIRG